MRNCERSYRSWGTGDSFPRLIKLLFPSSGLMRIDGRALVYLQNNPIKFSYHCIFHLQNNYSELAPPCLPKVTCSPMVRAAHGLVCFLFSK